MPLPIPKFIRTAFAQLGQRNVIPETTNNITGAAGYNQGFGEINMLPEGAGGIPPDGKDMNGILYELSAAIQFSQAGRYFPFNQDFANAIGGYDKGAIVASQSDLSVAYQSTIDANSVAPPSAGWKIFGDVPNASMEASGIIRIATILESLGVSESLAVSPAGLKSLRDRLTFLENRRGLGFGQVVTSFTNIERPANTWFLNNTINPKFVNAIKSPSGNIIWVIEVLIGSTVTVTDLFGAFGPTNVIHTVSAIVPPGASYRIRFTEGTSAYTVQEMATP